MRCLCYILVLLLFDFGIHITSGNALNSSKLRQAGSKILENENIQSENISNFFHPVSSQNSSYNGLHASKIVTYSSLSTLTAANPNAMYHERLSYIKPTTQKPYVTTQTAVRPTVMYQPVIHLENASKNDLFQYIYLFAKNPNLQKLSQGNMKQISVAKKPNVEGPLKNDHVVNPKEVRSIFRLARFSKVPLLRCQQPEATISIKCFSNVAKIIFTSDSETRFEAKVSTQSGPFQHTSTQSGPSQLTLDGYKMSTFVVWWKENGTLVNNLSRKLTSGRLQMNCTDCNNLETVLLLHDRDHACLIPVICGNGFSEKVLFKGNPTRSFSAIADEPIMATSMILHNNDNNNGNFDVEDIESGRSVDVILRASSLASLPGLFVKECRISFSEGHPMILLSSGCSVSNMLDDFKISNKTNTEKNVFTTTSRILAFATNSSIRNMTLGCKVLVCDGFCDIHSSCQNVFLNHMDVGVSQTIGEVYLQTSFRVIPETIYDSVPNKTQNETTNHMTKFSTSENEKKKDCRMENSNAMYRYECYIYLALISFLYLILLATFIIYFRYKQTEYKWTKFEEEIESPPRMLYMEDSSTRKRSPPSRVNMLDISN